jgi:DNA-binding transcriptional ArsR family regulator
VALPGKVRSRGAAGDLAEMARHADEAAELLKALANEQRLLVLCSLVAGPKSVGALNAGIELSQSALSQHLAVLREAGVVSTRRDAQTIYYSLAEGPAAGVMTALHAWFCRRGRGPQRPRRAASPK